MPQPLKGKTPSATASLSCSGFSGGESGNVTHSDVQLPDRSPTVIVCIFLALAVWVVFGQTVRHEFVNYDNAIYIYENPNISAGLSLKGILWAFTHLHVDEWWPINAISHMVDCEIFGLYAGGHHLTNILLHAATAILLFLVLRSMTGLRRAGVKADPCKSEIAGGDGSGHSNDAPVTQAGAFWRSAFVAVVFAIHPLRVESVAWVTERKDVLSGLFFVLTLGAYVKHVSGVKGQVSGGRKVGPFVIRHLLSWYWLALLFFALGMLSKSSVVTMPFLLLLLDWWPLRRIDPSTINHQLPTLRRLVLEKVPFLLLAVAGSVTTILAVKDIHPIEALSLPWRMGNAVVAYATYLKQMIYPVGLAVFYPHPENRLPLWTVGLSVLVLLIISAVVLAGWRKRPYLLVGWLWYLGMLVPVIGLLQVGSQAYADRYTYLPQIGVYLLLAWGAAELCGAWRHHRAVLGTASAVILAGLGVLAYRQTTHWRDSSSLWLHTLDCTSGNYLAHNNLGGMLADQGKLEEAISHYELSLQIKPHFAEAHYNLGVALGAQGKAGEAIPHYEQAVQFKPNYANAHNNLGNALAAQGKLAEAIQNYERALQIKSDFPEAHYNFANALVKQRKLTEAIEHYERALQLRPDYAEAHYNLGNRLAAQGKPDEAIKHFEKAVQLRPGYAEAHNNLGNRLASQKKWNEATQSFERALRLKPDYAEAHNNFGAALAGQGKMEEAIRHYEQASQIRPDYAQAHANLGNALALQGRSDEAMQHFHEALELATAQTNAALAQAILKRLESFQSAPQQPQTP